MSGGRCHRRKMMGRGAEGGCGTEERPCPVSRVSSHAAASTASRAEGVGLYVQARKALSEHSPFDDEEALARVATLPVGLAAALSRSSDGRRKHRKVQSETVKKAAASAQPAAAAWSVWSETEEYFRPITLADIDILVPKLPFASGSAPDSCLTIPLLRNIEGRESQSAVVTAAAREFPNLVEAAVATSGAEGVLEVAMCDGVDAKKQQHEKEDPQQQQATEIDDHQQQQHEKEHHQQTQAMEIDEQQQQQKEHQQQQQTMEVDEVRIDRADGCVPTEKDVDLLDYSSMNWILGSKSRALLASERPNKKRKLLGSDAGLEKLLLLPHSQVDDSTLCDYCCLGDYGGKSNRFLHCDSCKVSVHMKCYGVHDVPEGAWLCSFCRQSVASGGHGTKDGAGPCLLCPMGGGALKPVEAEVSQSRTTVKFAHLFCSLWMPEVYIDNIEMMEPIMNVEKVQEMRKRLVCNLCKVKQGACIRCSHGTCRTSFHPVCAREAKQRMEIWGKGKCDDVELRAFCSKHSTIQDVGSVRRRKDTTVPVPSHSSVTNALPVTSPINRIPKIRITRKERDKTIGQENTTNSSFGSVIENETPSELDELAVRVGSDSSRALLNQNTLTAGESCNAVDNSAPDTNDLLMILKKLSDCGKINIADVALETQIPSNSLESALADEATSLSHELKSKINKWFKDYVHLGGPVSHLNSVGGCTLSSRAKDDGDDGIHAAKVTGLGELDGVLVKSLPPRRRTKSSVRVLKDNKVVCSSGEAFIDQSCNGKLVDETVDDRLLEDVADATCSGSPFHYWDYHVKDKDVLKKMQEDASGCSEVSSFVQQHQQCNGKSMALEDQDALVHHQQQHIVETVSSFGSGVNQAAKIYDTVKLASDNVSIQEQSECDVGTLTTGAFDSKTAEPYSSACIHPFIQKKLTKMQNISEADSNGHQEECSSLNETDLLKRNCYSHQSSYSSCTKQSNVLDAKKLEQLAKARGMGIMELCPEDEMEGELLYLQNKLLNTAVTIKHCCENLMLRVVRHLPEELDLLKKRRWDLVVVNQFLRHVREAKKRGRKEKRHKEYQAVLAAAAAAVETSSRGSSLRKETNDPLVFSRAEVDAGSARAVTCPLTSRAKLTHSKLAAPKISSEKQSETNAALCDVCGRAETMLNRIFFCGGCKVAVHLDCYRRPRNPISSWFCDVCEERQSNSSSHGHTNADDWGKPCSVVQCGLCGAVTGAFRRTLTRQWVHSFCAEWVLESTFRRGQENPVEGMEAILKDKEMLNCSICHQNTGLCMKCSYGHCQMAFHPFCARSVGLFMCVRTINGKLQHKAYCEKHGTEQRQKADIQQYGAEELKSIKQIRVELEKVRLLCERINRREKLKRELVLCSHDILASRRDYVAFSLLVNSSFFPPGISSESATTSINNRSYSDTIQRSDDVTVDSSVSVKRKFRLPLKMEIDRKTEASSQSRLVSARKGAARMTFSGKQIPHRPTSVTSRSSTDGEKRLKPRKHMEIFQKEVVMTSDQASIQNRRLPKGFVYVPVDSLPKTRDIETHEPRKPDG